jgi:hypothetical protein
MRNVEDELDLAGVTRLVINETVTVTPHPAPHSRGMAHIGKSDEEWGWNDLQDYVVHEIEKRRGVFARTATKEYGIFNSFMKRWGLKAPAIARYAFEVCGGEWQGRAVKVEDFCKAADGRFAVPISDRIL